MKKTDSNFKKWMIVMGICGVFGTGTFISPIIAKLVEAYPDTPVATIRTLSTIPSLFGLVLGMILSLFLGKKIKYKPVLVAGACIAGICGMLPAFINATFTQILISRILFAVGFGFFGTRNAIVRASLADESESAKWLGAAMFFNAAVGVVGQILSGILGDINWRYSFLIYGFCFICMLINIFWYTEPSPVIDTQEKGEKVKGHFNWMIIPYFLVLMLSTLCLYPFLSSISMFIANRGIGTATESGFASSGYTIGMAILSMFFGTIAKKFPRRGYAMGAAIVVIGYVLTLSARTSAIPCIIGGLCCGGGFGFIMLFSIQWAQDMSDKATVVVAGTLMSCAVSCGSFFSTYFMAFLQKIGAGLTMFPTDIEKTFFIGTIVYAIIAVVAAIVDIRPKEVKAKELLK